MRTILMKPSKDLFSNHSKEYARFRPAYPNELYNFLFSLTPNHQYAWDAGTGNGQVACRLAERFKHVWATDLSGQQVSQAPQMKNLSYHICRAEDPGIPAESVSLITVAQALHWFSIPEFFKKVKSSLHNDGILACWGYDLIQGPPDVTRLLTSFYSDTLRDYWAPERRHIDAHYTDIAIPFQSEKEFTLSVSWDLERLLGYLRTWSAVTSYVEKHGVDPVDDLAPSLVPYLRGEVTFIFPVFMKLWTPRDQKLS